MMKKRTVSLVLGALGVTAALAFGAGIVGSAIAAGTTGRGDETARDGMERESAAPMVGISVEELARRLSKQGYPELYEIERKRDVYEVKARAADGGKVELYVDSKTGAILKQEADD